MDLWTYNNRWLSFWQRRNDDESYAVKTWHTYPTQARDVCSWHTGRQIKTAVNGPQSCLGCQFPNQGELHGQRWPPGGPMGVEHSLNLPLTFKGVGERIQTIKQSCRVLSPFITWMMTIKQYFPMSSPSQSTFSVYPVPQPLP